MKISKYNNQNNQVFVELSAKEFPCVIDCCEREHLTHCIVCNSNIKFFHRGWSDTKEYFDAIRIQIFVYKKAILHFSLHIFLMLHVFKQPQKYIVKILWFSKLTCCQVCIQFI